MGKKFRPIIYGLHDGDGRIRYVGRSLYGTHRLSDHRHEARKGSTNMPVHKWMRNRGVDVIEILVLEEVTTREELVGREDFWIQRLQTHVDHGGLNVAAADRGGTPGRLVSEETRRKMSESAKQRVANEPPEDRERRLAVLKANGQSRPFKGRTHTQDSIDKIKETKRKRRNA